MTPSLPFRVVRVRPIPNLDICRRFAGARDSVMPPDSAGGLSSRLSSAGYSLASYRERVVEVVEARRIPGVDVDTTGEPFVGVAEDLADDGGVVPGVAELGAQ
jgi:hypothetical protein